jgi:aryl-alcohol dehydrogenase-like predicted oxidoreductase
MTMERRRLGSSGLEVTRLGLGLAAIGRPGYITLGRAHDLPGTRSPDALWTRCAEVLDAARAAGIRYADAARSYGRAEEFLGRWLVERGVPRDDMTVGSKWGYRYTAGWTVDAVVHEQKEHSVGRFRAQLAETRALLGERLDLYQVHSATVDSGVLGDPALLAALVDARRRDAFRAVGLTLSGPESARALELALAARVDGERVFDVVQATLNVLEPSLAAGLAAAHDAGLGVIVKEVHANGRLTDANDRADDQAMLGELRAAADGMPVDRLAVAFALSHPFVDVVLSGAATTGQLVSHVAASAAPARDAVGRDRLAALAEPPERYWRTRGALPWT